MDISTGSWFKYLREEVLTEGLRDIGLPEKIVDFIENAMARAPEKSKMYAGNQWKKYQLSRGYRGNARCSGGVPSWGKTLKMRYRCRANRPQDSKPEIVAPHNHRPIASTAMLDHRSARCTTMKPSTKTRRSPSLFRM